MSRDYGVLFHELGHVDAHHGVIRIEQETWPGLGQLGFADAGWAREIGRSRLGRIRIGQARLVNGERHWLTATTASC
jgi:Zn-dependent protease with chaperone function